MLRCKFSVVSVTPDVNAQTGEKHSESIQLQAVYGPGNEDWSKYTPSGNMQFCVTNPAAFDKLKPGQSVFIDISPAPEGA